MATMFPIATVLLQDNAVTVGKLFDSSIIVKPNYKYP